MDNKSLQGVYKKGKNKKNIWFFTGYIVIFSACFQIPIIFSNLKSNCSTNWLILRNLQEQVKKAFCYQKLFWPFTVWMNCCKFSAFSLKFQKIFSITRTIFSHSRFGNKIPYKSTTFFMNILCFNVCKKSFEVTCLIKFAFPFFFDHHHCVLLNCLYLEEDKTIDDN